MRMIVDIRVSDSSAGLCVVVVLDDGAIYIYRTMWQKWERLPPIPAQ